MAWRVHDILFPRVAGRWMLRCRGHGDERWRRIEGGSAASGVYAMRMWRVGITPGRTRRVWCVCVRRGEEGMGVWVRVYLLASLVCVREERRGGDGRAVR